MGLGGETHGGRPRKAWETTDPPGPPVYDTPTSFLIASEDMMDMSSKAAAFGRSVGTFGVESLQETGDGSSGQGGNGNSDEGIHGSDGSERRRRSTLKPLPLAIHRDSSPEFNEEVLNNTRATEASPSRQNHRRGPPLSTSESLASVSQISHLQGLSLTSSPKSIYTPSFRPSDDESMDEVTSQAIGSSGEDENEPPSEIHDSSPQLIMPSIKMPSRRPFTEKGKGIGLLKILIAGDSGMLPPNLFYPDMLRSSRRWQDFSYQIHRADLRRYCACGSLDA
jgi:hypothetical protein